MCYFWIIYILILLFEIHSVMKDREWVGELHVNKLTDESSCKYVSIQVNPQEAGQQRRNHNLMYNHCSLNITRTLLKTKARPCNPSCFLDCFIMQKRSLPSLLHSAAYDEFNWLQQAEGQYSVLPQTRSNWKLMHDL